MDKHSIGSLITDLSLPTIAAHWRSLTVPQLLKSQVNHVYAMDCPEHAAILRLTHSSQRSEDLIRGELEWIEFLAARDIAVSHPLRTRDDRLTLRLDYGDTFVRGYLSERPLPLSWFDLLPRFCSFRDILLTLFACKTQMSPDHLFYQSVTRNYTLGNHLHNFDFTAFQQSACNV